MAELKDLLNEMINDIEEITDLFYQQQVIKGNEKMIPFIQKMTKAVDQMAIIDGFDSDALLEKLKEALDAMEDKDYVLLGDLMQYEIAEQLKSYL